jgi:ABC-type transport system involved in multi-copper enzyme maturation permease subunit
MIWLTWRQFRGQAVTALAALAALGGGLVVLGLVIRHFYQLDIVDCTPANFCQLSDGIHRFEQRFSGIVVPLGLLIILIPGIIGMFWGGPLITRELETGTHRLVWNQSVTRTSWLAVKLVTIGIASMVLTGVLSLLLTWAASPFDAILGDRFGALVFPARNIVPVGYGLFAFVLGTIVGLLVRRTVPAMAITLVAFAVIQVILPIAVRSHLRPPVTQTTQFTTATTRGGIGLGITSDGHTHLESPHIPDAWVLTNEVELLDANGNSVNVRDCMGREGSLERDSECMEKMNLHYTVTYQPGNRYWTFQWLELTIFVVLAGLLAAFGFWYLPRQLG